MSRKERQEAARKRRQYQIEAWIDELGEHVKSGKTYKEACEIMAAETAHAMDRNPQQKHELVEAWKELFARIHKIAGEVSSANVPHHLSRTAGTKACSAGDVTAGSD